MKGLLSLVFIIAAFTACGVRPKKVDHPENKVSTRVFQKDEYALTHDLYLKSNTHIRVETLRLARDVKIVTNGFNLEIEAKDAEFDQNLIVTFEGERLIANAEGLYGGEITLNIGRATGDLEVLMLGQNGGDGEGGMIFNGPAKAGDAGKDGVLGVFKVVGRGIPYCLVHPTYGGDGQQGQDGLNGSDGFPGGDGGHLVVQIHNRDQFNLNIHGAGGDGGLGGLGSAGQLGGKVGATGKTPFECSKSIGGKKPVSGRAGENGRDGRQGLSGEPPVFSIL